MLPSHIAAVLVLFDAVPGSEFTVKLAFDELPLHAPFDDIVYVVVTLFLLLLLTVLYVVPLILPLPFSLQLPPDGDPDKLFVLPSHIAAVLVLFDADPGA